jgi:YVTN family beta-propeller protein
VAFGAGSVWATETSLNVVVRINPRTNRVERRFKIPGYPELGNLRYGGGVVWVGTQNGNRIFRIETRTGRVSSVRVGNGPRSVAVSPSAVWVSNFHDDTVSRIDPSTRKVVATIPVGEGPDNAAVAADGTVFVPNVTAGTVSRIDPTTNEVVDTLVVGAMPFPTAFAFGDIWVPLVGGHDVARIHVG